MFGLGKTRTKLGKFIDKNKNEINQEWLAKSSGLSRDGISRLCDGEKNVSPTEDSMRKVISALRRKGYDVTMADFW